MHININLQPLFFTQLPVYIWVKREPCRVVSLACSVLIFFFGWWSDGWCLFFFFFCRINWTLSSWLMCSRSLLDLNQLYSSRVKTTGAWDGGSQMNGEGKPRHRKVARSCREDNSQSALRLEQQRFQIKMCRQRLSPWQVEAHAGGLTDSSEEGGVVDCIYSVQTSN